MRFAVIAAATIAATSLAGCGGPAEQPAAVNAVENAAAFQARLRVLPEGERNGVFIRAIRDANQDCQHVESSSESGSYRGAPVWTARCTGGTSFAIVIGNGGTAQVLDESAARLVRDGNMNLTENAQ